MAEGIMQSYQAYQTASALKIWRIALLTSEIDVDARDINGCYRLPHSKNSRGYDKRIIVQFFNRENADTMLNSAKESVLKILEI